MEHNRFFRVAYNVRAMGLSDELAANALIDGLIAVGLKVSRYTLPLRLLLAANISPDVALRHDAPLEGGCDAPQPDILSALKPISGGNNGLIDYTLYNSGKAATVDYNALLTAFKKEYKRAPNRKERRLMLKAANNTSDIKAAWRLEQYKGVGKHGLRRSESVSGGMAADNDKRLYDSELKKAPKYSGTCWTKYK